MGMQVKLGETRSYAVRGKTVRGFRLAGWLEATAVNVPILPSDIDTTKIFAKITLKRKNGNFILFNDFITPIVLAGIFGDDPGMELLHPKNGTNLYEVLASGASVKEIQTLGYDLDLGFPINLRGEDILECEVSLPSASFLNNMAASTTAYFDIQEIDEIGVESLTPYFKTQAIQSGQTTAQIVLGDNVTEVFFINADKNDILNASSPIASISLSSDKLSWNKPFVQLLAERQNQVTGYANLIAHRHNFKLYEGMELDNVTVSLTLNAANVNVGQNWIAWRSFYIDERLSKLAEITHAEHEVTNRMRKGLSHQGANLNALRHAKNQLK